MSTASDRQYLAFTISGGRFAIRVDSVREVLESAAITRLPGTERHMMGVINLRGTMVPVIDLGRWLGLAPEGTERSANIIVMSREAEGGGALFGALADSVQAVIEIEPSSIQESEVIARREGPNALKGLTRQGDDFIAVLDPAFVHSGLGG